MRSSHSEGNLASILLNYIGENNQCPVETERRVLCYQRVVAEGLLIPLDGVALTIGKRLIDSGTPEPALKLNPHDLKDQLTCVKCNRRRQAKDSLCSSCRVTILAQNHIRTCIRCNKQRSSIGTKRWALQLDGSKICTECIRKERDVECNTGPPSSDEAVLNHPLGELGLAG